MDPKICSMRTFKQISEKFKDENTALMAMRRDMEQKIADLKNEIEEAKAQNEIAAKATGAVTGVAAALGTVVPVATFISGFFTGGVGWVAGGLLGAAGGAISAGAG